MSDSRGVPGQEADEQIAMAEQVQEAEAVGLLPRRRPTFRGRRGLRPVAGIWAGIGQGGYPMPQFRGPQFERNRNPVQLLANNPQDRPIGFHILDYDFQGTIDASFALSESTPTPTSVKKNPLVIEEEELERNVKPFIGFELDEGVFRGALDKKDRAQRIALVEYMINKFQTPKEYKTSPAFEKDISLIDEFGIFQPLEPLILSLVQKPQATVSPKQLQDVQEARLQRLNALLVDLKANPFAELDVYTNGSIVDNRKKLFSEAFNKLLNERSDLCRADVLDLFKQLKRRDEQSPFIFIHDQYCSPWDKFRLLFKSNLNGPDEAYTWHNSTYQEVIKALKEAYIKIPKNLPENRLAEEQYFIDYRRRNFPWHPDETETRSICGPSL